MVNGNEFDIMLSTLGNIITIAVIILVVIFLKTYIKTSCISTLALLSIIMTLYLVPPELNSYKFSAIRILSYVIVIDLLLWRDLWEFIIRTRLVDGYSISHAFRLRISELVKR